MRPLVHGFIGRKKRKRTCIKPQSKSSNSGLFLGLIKDQYLDVNKNTATITIHYTVEAGD